MSARFFIIFALLCMLSAGVCGHPEANTITEKDSTTHTPRRKLARLLKQTITVQPRDKAAERIAAQQDREYFERYAGRTINSIRIVRRNVYDSTATAWGEKKVNALHRMSQERTIRRDIFIRPGDTLDPLLIKNNRQLIRSRDYISKADVEVVPLAEDTMKVDLVFYTRDRWSIGVDLHAESNADTYFELYDDNLLGWGNSLNIKTYFNWKTWVYGGNLFEFATPNLWGSFFAGRIIAGKGFDESDFGAEVKKDFIRPTDYMIGAYGYYRKEPIYLYLQDDEINTTYTKLGVWGGKSFYLPSMKNSLYVTGHYNMICYDDRPYVDIETNPYFHDEHSLLFSVGLYREQFRTSSLIYGYGVDEDIAYGYQFALYGGRTWGEFRNRWYTGGMFNAGHFTSIGYLRWGIGLGSYINPDGRFYRTTLISELNWFSNLLGEGRYRTRQFIDLNFTRGWNRLNGYHEYVEFDSHAELRGLREDIYGTNRLAINSETVCFTPWNFKGFRFALYGFADMGILGYDGHLFNNGFYSTLGVGVRIKNEHLIFRTINIRLGIALGKNGWLGMQYFNISTEDKRQPLRFIPEKATVIDYNTDREYGTWN